MVHDHKNDWAKANYQAMHGHHSHAQTHRSSHYTQKVSNLGRTGSNCCGDSNMGWVPFHEVVESEEKHMVEKFSISY